MKKSVNYNSIKKELTNHIENNNFKGIISSAKYFKKEAKNAEDEVKHLKYVNKYLEMASSIAIKYFDENENNMSEKKSDEIHDLLEFSEDFKKNLPKSQTSKIEKTLRTFSFAAIGISLLSNSTELTGNVISHNDFGSFSFLGTTLFFMGIVGAFLTQKK